MNTQLFFDDSRLFIRNNVCREAGKAELIPDSVFTDGISAPSLCMGDVFKTEDGYRMVYGGSLPDRSFRIFMAKSPDGIHFSPCPVDSDKENRVAENEIFALGFGEEVGCIFEDERATDKNERYKMLYTEYSDPDLFVYDTLYVSPDLVHWTKKEGVFWGDGAEPITGVFYNEKRGCYTVLERPFWGIRMVGYSETDDWVHYTKYAPCLQQDGLDGSLDEIYGMKAISYNGMFIGFAHIYCRNKPCLSAKFSGGCMEIELAYSYDGRYWMRGEREPFISGKNPDDVKTLGRENAMIWVSDAEALPDGSVLIYAETSTKEHGDCFSYGSGKEAAMQVYRVRKDGFVCLKSEDTFEDSVVATREKLWKGGDAHINISAESATVAFYASDESVLLGGNVIGVSHPIEGFSHDDCIPFSGDETDWVPTFKSGKTADELKGKTIVIEVKFRNGRLYSIAGDCTDVFNTEAARYRMKGIEPIGY